MSYYTYVLVSKDGRKTYTGHTSNLQKRILEHNFGEVKSSKAYRPYKLFYSEEFKTRQAAKKRELYFKSFAGRQNLKKICKEYHAGRHAKGVASLAPIF